MCKLNTVLLCAVLIPSCVQKCLSGGLFESFCSVVWCLFGALLHSAGVNSDCVLALLAADRAAPGKLAGAALHHLSSPRSVPRPAAHQLTAIWCQPRGSITSPTSSPRDTVVRVEMTEIWGGRKVHKVSGSRGFDLGVTG